MHYLTCHVRFARSRRHWSRRRTVSPRFVWYQAIDCCEECARECPCLVLPICLSHLGFTHVEVKVALSGMES